MFVRVFDVYNKKYYKSIVYAILNTGCFKQAIVINPFEESFVIVPYFNNIKSKPEILFQTIDSDTNEWVFLNNADLLKLEKYFHENKADMLVTCFNGYQDIFDSLDFMLNIIKNHRVPLSETSIKIRTNEDKDTWNYISSQSDADAFMKLFAGFHDSTLDSLNYEECEDSTKLTVRFDNSFWFGVAELCFEGIIALNLRPPAENAFRDIYDATLIIKDECVFWADSYMPEEDLNHKGTFIKALNLKWRKIYIQK